MTPFSTPHALHVSHDVVERFEIYLWQARGREGRQGREGRGGRTGATETDHCVVHGPRNKFGAWMTDGDQCISKKKGGIICRVEAGEAISG